MLPVEKRDGFIFHAKELFNGGAQLPRDEWPIERKLPLIERVLAIPAKFGLPICYGCIEKQGFPHTDPEIAKKYSYAELSKFGYATVFAHASVQTEVYMRQYADNEVAQIVAEDKTVVRELVRYMQSVYRDKNKMDQLEGIDEAYFPFTKIIDAPSFQLKTEASLLQVADMCAYAFNRFMRNLPYGVEHFSKIRGQMLLFGDHPQYGLKKLTKAS